MDVNAFWNDVISQNADALPSYFCKDAVVRWRCTNEQFTAAEYVRANCEYPGEWSGKIERVEECGKTVVLAGRVFSADGRESHHVVSFIKLEDGFIKELDEYWAKDGGAPSWRKDMKIGKAIK